MSTDAPAAGESGVHDKVTPLQAQTPGEGNFLPDYSADTVGRKDLKDLLDIGREVRAFARLIAARELEPPLSIGLFGEWGVR